MSYQQLLDRQERDDSHRVMEAIMLLGEQGVLNEPNDPNKESPHANEDATA